LKPTDAALETVKRLVAMAPPKLLNAQGRPKFQLDYYAINKAGELGCASIYPSKYAAHDGREARLLDAAFLFPSGSSGSRPGCAPGGGSCCRSSPSRPPRPSPRHLGARATSPIRSAIRPTAPC